MTSVQRQASKVPDSYGRPVSDPCSTWKIDVNVVDPRDLLDSFEQAGVEALAATGVQNAAIEGLLAKSAPQVGKLHLQSCRVGVTRQQDAPGDRRIHYTEESSHGG